MRRDDPARSAGEGNSDQHLDDDGRWRPHGSCKQVREPASDRSRRQRVRRGEQCCRQIDDGITEVDISSVYARRDMADIGGHDGDHRCHKSCEGQIF